MYNPVSNKTDFPAMEKDILAFWEADDTFKKSLDKNRDKTPFDRQADLIYHDKVGELLGQCIVRS